MAQVACDVLQLLVSYWEKLQMFETSLPRKISEVSLCPVMLTRKRFPVIVFGV